MSIKIHILKKNVKNAQNIGKQALKSAMWIVNLCSVFHFRFKLILTRVVGSFGLVILSIAPITTCLIVLHFLRTHMFN